jgi:hypothetical protein
MNNVLVTEYEGIVFKTKDGKFAKVYEVSSHSSSRVHCGELVDDIVNTTIYSSEKTFKRLKFKSREDSFEDVEFFTVNVHCTNEKTVSII